MKHYLNVCEVNGAEIAPTDVITFGSPCQDMSIAGKREGIKHSDHGDEETTRSGLFYEATRIIKEMRDATHGEYPKYAVWENVPGAFSSNKGWDFLAVLEALCSVCDSTISIPRPYDKRKPDKLVWSGAGEIMGDNFSVCWRTLDAQYWGVPQRRKRIYLVTDFNTRCAREILFKPDGLRGDMPQSNDAWKTTSADAMECVNGSVGNHGNIACCLDASYYKGVGERNGIERQIVAYDARNHNAQEISGTIQAKPNGGQSLNFINPVCYQNTGRGWWNQSEVAETLRTPSGGDATKANLVSLCYDARGNGDGETVSTITGDHENRITDYTALAVQETYQDKTGTLMANSHPGSYTDQDAYNDMLVTGKSHRPPRKYIIRRLMPVECARLQGFPDGWGQLAQFNPADSEFWENVRKTYAKINGKKYKPVKNLKKWYDKLHNDGAEYKMWGNGIALPCAEYVLHGIAEHGAKTLGSLFDGSGGFPLAGAMNGIIPLWSSEIEPYPIAVTKSRFKE